MTATYAWLARWDQGELLVWGGTIEEARLEARKHAGPHAPVRVRLASSTEKTDPELNQPEPA